MSMILHRMRSVIPRVQIHGDVNQSESDDYLHRLADTGADFPGAIVDEVFIFLRQGSFTMHGS